MHLFLISLQEIFIGPSLRTIAGMGGELWSGNFDLTLLKPLPLQFHISIRNWNLWAISKLLISIVIIVISLIHLNKVLSLLNILAFIISTLSSLIIIYSILLILNCIGFWYLAVPFEWLFNSFTQLGRYPVGIYPGILKSILTWIIPIGLIFTVPVEILIRNISVLNLIGTLSFSILVFIIASFFFRVSIRRYSSASS